MFKVKNSRTGECMVTLDYPSREAREIAFRGLSNDGVLRCPHCDETVVFRQKEILTAHFSHLPHSACPYSQEPIDLLEARSALYRFLKRNIIGTVTIEYAPEQSLFPRAVDCWVEMTGETFAYWIFERGVRSATKRNAIREEFRKLDVKPHFVFHSQMLHKSKAGGDTFALGTTERTFLRRTKYDPPYSTCGSLHYIDVHRHEWLTLRGTGALDCVGQFTGKEIGTSMEWVKVCKRTGEIFHPGEQEHQLFEQASLFEESRLSIVPKRELPATSRVSPYAHLAPDVQKMREEWDKLPRTNETVAQIIARLYRKGRDETPISYVEREGTCEFCGTKTRDWIVFDGKTGLCKCRACYGRSERR